MQKPIDIARLTTLPLFVKILELVVNALFNKLVNPCQFERKRLGEIARNVEQTCFVNLTAISP